MDLTTLGLTKNEAKAYKKLLLLGKTTAGRLAKESGVPYGRIYTVLASLEAKTLLRVLPEKTKLYIPASPEKLNEFFEQKRKDLERVEQEIKEYKTLYDEHAEEAVQVAKGKHNFFALARQVDKAQEYSYNIKYLYDSSARNVQSAKQKAKSKVQVRTLGRYDDEVKDKYEFWKKIVKHQKPIPNDGVVMSLRDDKTVVLGLIKSNTSILIRDQPFAKLMKTLFDNYYDNS